MLSKLVYVLNYLLDCEENWKARREEKRHIDFSRRYVEGAIKYNDEIIHYETIRRRHFKKIYNKFINVSGWKSGHSVLDYGCGKGYVLYLLNEYGKFDKIAGIDILPELCTIAETNMKKNKIKAKIVNADARIFKEIDQYDVMYMFNPFPEKAMKEVAERINESLQRVNRQLYIIYVNDLYREILLNKIENLQIIEEIMNVPRYGCKCSIFFKEMN